MRRWQFVSSVCQVWSNFISYFQYSSNQIFCFIFSFFQGADGLNILIFTHAGPTGGCGVGRLEACAGVTCWLLGGSGRSGCTGSHVSLPQASSQVLYSCVKSYFFISFVSFQFFPYLNTCQYDATQNQHIDSYSSFHRVNPIGEIPLLIISFVKSAADADCWRLAIHHWLFHNDRRRERQHLEDVARIAEVKQLLERLAVWRRLGPGVLFGKSVFFF